MKIQRHKHSKWKWRVTKTSGDDVALFRTYFEAKEYSEEFWGEPETPKTEHQQDMELKKLVLSQILATDKVMRDHYDGSEDVLQEDVKRHPEATLTIQNPSQEQVERLKGWASELVKITVDTES